MTTIATSTASTATAYPNQRKIDRCQNGVLWAAYQPSSTVALQSIVGSYSTDDGATWSAAVNLMDVNVNIGIGQFSIFIDLDDYLHLVWKQTSTKGSYTDGYVYYTRGTPNAGRTAWTWAAATVLETANTNYTLPDVVAHRQGTGWMAHVVTSWTDGTSVYCLYHPFTISSGGTISKGTQVVVGGPYAASGSPPAAATIDFHHTGDSKTVASTPDLYVAWSAGKTGSGFGIRFKKAAYSSGSWTWGAEREIDSTKYVLNNTTTWLNCLYDGSRVIIPCYVYDGTDAHVMLYERDSGDTTTTTRALVSPATGADRPAAGSATFNDNGDVYIFGVDNTGTFPLSYRVWTRATTTLGALVTIDGATNITPFASVKRGYSNNRVEFVYTGSAASPYAVTYGSILRNQPPNAPTDLSPAGSAVVDRSIVQRLSWMFSDPNAGDSQSKFDLQWRHAGSSDAWNVITQTTPNSYWDAPASTFPAEQIEWQVRTYDQSAAVGPYSALAYFTAADPATPPTITAPTSGGTVSQNPTTVTWSASGQQAYQVRRVADNAGTADPTTVYWDSGQVVDTATRSLSVPFETNNRWEHVQVRVQQGGLWSAWSDVRVNVSYTTPATASLVATPNNTAGSISIAITNPAPSGGQPTVAYNDVYVRTVGDTGPGVRIATRVANNGTATYWTPASGVAYEFLVRTFGSNSTSTDSAWTA